MKARDSLQLQPYEERELARLQSEYLLQRMKQSNDKPSRPTLYAPIVWPNDRKVAAMHILLEAGWQMDEVLDYLNTWDNSETELSPQVGEEK
jgi:hypothetical protein